MRFKAVDADELSDSQAMLLCELGGEEPPSGAVVLDEEATEGEGDIVAFIPRATAGIEPKDFAQRVAVLAALGEPTATAERSGRVVVDGPRIRSAVDGTEVAEVKVGGEPRAQFLADALNAVGAEPITPEDAKVLLRCVTAGTEADIAPMEAVAAKLRALAGESWR